MFRSRVTWQGDIADIPRRGGVYQKTLTRFDADAMSGLSDKRVIPFELGDIEGFLSTSSLISPSGLRPRVDISSCSTRNHRYRRALMV